MKKAFRKLLPKLVGLKLNSLFFVNSNSALEQAFYLFCAPRRGKPRPEEIPFLDAAKVDKEKIGEISVQFYHWKGKTPSKFQFFKRKKTVLLVHGWESNSHRWKALIEKLLPESYHIAALDAPAHGNSSGKLFNVPLYAKCMETAISKFKPDFIIGHSLGAMTTVFLQHKRPIKNVSKIILLGPPSELTEIMGDFQEIFGFHTKFMNGLENLFEERFGYTFESFSTARFAQSLQQKGLIIHDKFDRIAPVSASESIHENWKNSRLVITEGAGHSLNNEKIYGEIIRSLKS